MSFQGIVAQNPILNASLNDGHDVQAKIMAAGLSANPRLYANGVAPPGAVSTCMLPELSKQDNSDLPAWATNFWDQATTLESMGLPADTPVYLQVWVTERGNFYDVAQVKSMVAAGMPIDKALF